MIIQSCIENRYSMILIVPASIRRELGWVKGDKVQVYQKNGVLSYAKVKVTNVKYRKRTNEDRPGQHIKVRGKPAIR